MMGPKFFAAAFAIALSAAAFEVTNVSEEIAEAGAVTRTRVADGKTIFSYIAPKGWIVSTEPSDKRVSLRSTANDGTFSLRLLTNSYPASSAKFKEHVMAAYKDVTVGDEFEASCGSGSGMGLDFRHFVADKYAMNTRAAVFRAPDGALEVSLSSGTTPVEKLHSIWVAFINSVRVDSKQKP